MKRFISGMVSFLMVLSIVLVVPTEKASAAETVTTEDLFLKYPTYLSNSEMNEGIQKAEAAYYAVLNSYSDSDETVAIIMTTLSDGISIALKEMFAELGIGESYYERIAKKAAQKYMQNLLECETSLKKATAKVEKVYKGVKKTFSTASLAKDEVIAELKKLATENDIGITPQEMEKYVKDTHETIKKDLDAIGAVDDLWKYMVEFTELHAIERTTVDMLLDELTATGQTNSDLYLGLSLLKADMEKDMASYILEYYATEYVIDFLSDCIDDLFSDVAGSVEYKIIKLCVDIFTDYVYVDAKADEIVEATMQTSFVSSIDICLSKYRTKFLKGQGTASDIETYEMLYGAYISAHQTALDTCYDVAKITDKFSLGGDCMIWSENLGHTYTYDNYIKWCKEEITHDISNNELDKTTGSSTITDALNEETIASRIERVMRLYPPGNKWALDYDGTKSSLGYAGKTFNHIFDESMCVKVENKYQYILTSDRNVRLIGRLEEEEVTEAALKELFSEVRIGDVVITSGQYDYLHAMTVVGMGENGPIVYDVDSKYGPAEEYTHLIQKYEFPYSKMADAFSTNGKYTQKPGISVYRAIKKVNTTNSGTSLYYEEYDDSVNYIIENGVLIGYTGARTTIEIPDGVTSIAANCFENNKSIKYVYMPDTITEIGDSAFGGCTNLQYMDLSQGLKKIEDHTFYGCCLLGGIIIPDGVTEIGNYVFGYCTKLKTVKIPDSVAKIGGVAFADCTALENIIIPDSVVELGSSAFTGCTALESIIIPDGITKIGGFTFKGCTNLSTVTLSKNLTTIGREAFANCTKLTDVLIPKSLVSVEDFLFAGAFANSGLKNVSFEDGITTIPDGLFVNCNELESIEIPDSVTKIGNYAFNNCKNLSAVTLSKNLIAMGRGTFENCTKLTDILIPKSLNPYDSSLTFEPFANSGLKNVSFEEGITSIPQNLFYDCNELESIEIPDTVVRIYHSAFAYCSKLKTVKIPNSVTDIEEFAFNGCPNLSDVYYSGTAEMWEKINIEEDYNDDLLSAQKHYENVEKPKEDTTGVTLSDGTYTYDGTAKSLEVKGAPAGATVEYENNGKTDAGTYNVKATVTAPGYNEKVLNATLKINPKALTVTGLTAENKIYDGTKTAVLSGGTLSGVVGQDDVTATFPTSGTFAKKDVGNGIAVSFANITLEGAKKANYTLTQPTVKANITAAPITVTADSHNVMIGDSLPELTYKVTSGTLAEGDSFSGELSTRANTSREGTYDILQGTLKLSSNYKLTYAKGTITVSDKTAQNIVISEITDKVYGDDSFVVTATADEVANLSNFIYESSDTSVAEIAADGAVTIVGAGETEITVKEPGNDTYAPFEKTQTLVVLAKEVTVEAIDLDAKTAILTGILDADVNSVELDFDKLMLEIVEEEIEPLEDEATEITVKITNFILKGEKAENYNVTTEELETTVSEDAVAKVSVTATNGTVTGEGMYLIGSEVTLVAEADEGYKFSGWYVGEESVSDEVEYTFILEADVELIAKFTKKSTGGFGGGGMQAGGDMSRPKDEEPEVTPEAQPEIPETTIPEVTPSTPEGFNDLAGYDWAKDSINALVEADIIKGTSATTFAPGKNIIRADFAVLLVRLFELTSDNTENFADVSSSDYFASELAIARNTGIVGGIGENKFAPRNNITRQDMMVMLYRAMTKLSIELSIGEVSAADFDEVSDYAKEAVSALISNGIVNGKNGEIDPKANATRAEVAVLLERVLNFLEK